MKRFLSNPSHAQPYDLLAICNHLKNEETIIISPKADGVHGQISIDSMTFEGELINETMFLFDILTYPKHLPNSYLDRCSYMSNYFNYNIQEIKSYDQFVDLLGVDDGHILNQIKQGNKSIQKPIYIIKTTPDVFLQILDIDLTKIIKSYPTDGFIIVDDRYNHPFKYKPKNMLTADLYNNFGDFVDDKGTVIFKDKGYANGIWRCKWINQLNGWKPHEIRTDKIVPNMSKTVQELTHTHQNYWLASDLINQITKNIYYSHNQKIQLSGTICNMLEMFHSIFQNNINKLISTYKIKTILDIGCGKMTSSKFNTFKKCSYYGIDLDPHCISVNNSIYRKNNNMSFEWTNMNNIKIKKDDRYDLLILNNSISYIDNIQTFIKNIQQYCTSHSVIYLMFIDKDVICEMESDDISIKKIDGDNYDFKYSWKDNSNAFSDKVVSCTEVIKTLENNNFLTTQISEPCWSNNQYDNIKQFMQIHKIVYAKYILKR